MKIIVLGTGYVGLVHAAACSEYGHEVYAYDNDLSKIEAFSSGQPEQIEKYVNEPGLSNIVRETIDRYLFFSADLESIVEGADAVFMCLPTPPKLGWIDQPDVLRCRCGIPGRIVCQTQGQTPGRVYQ